MIRSKQFLYDFKILKHLGRIQVGRKDKDLSFSTRLNPPRQDFVSLRGTIIDEARVKSSFHTKVALNTNSYRVVLLYTSRDCKAFSMRSIWAGVTNSPKSLLKRGFSTPEKMYCHR